MSHQSKKVWFAFEGRYGIVPVNKYTDKLLKQLDVCGGVLFCCLRSVEEPLLFHVVKFIDVGETYYD
jgi:hypothetical protein